MADQRRDNRKMVEPEEKQFDERVLHIDRVAKVTKGGRRFHFRALVAVGDKKGKIGIGVDKGVDVTTAVNKATDVAKKNMVTINLHNDTIPHDSQAKVSGANIYIKPASQGTGLIAGGVVRVVLEVAGVKNILSKSLGSNNKINSAYATLKALQLVEPSKNWITRTNHSVATKEAPKSVVQDDVSKPKATKAPVKKAEAKKEVKK